MPTRRRSPGDGAASVPLPLTHALDAEIEGISAMPDAVERIRRIGALMDVLDDEHERAAQLRLQAIFSLQQQEKWGYGRIAKETGLSKARVAQIARSARRAADPPPPDATDDPSTSAE